MCCCSLCCVPEQRAFASWLWTGKGHAGGLVVLVRVRSAEAPGNDVVRMSCLGLTTFLSAFATVRFVAGKRPANPVVHRPIPARVPGGYRPPAMQIGRATWRERVCQYD